MKLIKKFMLYALCPMLCIGFANANNFFAERTVTVLSSQGECIGNRRDPLCVFDTVIACVIRQQPELCRTVGLTYDQTMDNAVGYLAGADYTYRPIEMFITHRRSLCTNADGRACVLNPSNGELVAVDMSIANDQKFVVHLRRGTGGEVGTWSVIFATEFACWFDEDCS